MATKPFAGTITLDVRTSKEDWEPYLVPKAPKDSPNILFVLYDDTGLGAWSPYGGEINMPALQRVADKGLMYTQWHTAALCSPTRGMLLTGRNHHLNGNASITEGANGFPGQHARIPDACATVAQILQDAGWSTFWVGKNHNVPETDIAQGSTKKQWPLAKGFDRFYGFIGGETNQWYPDITVDNHPVELSEEHEPGFTHEEEASGGYHLSKDLADNAIQMIKDQKASNPSKPWYMWFCPGANHAPHHAPQSYIDKYNGKFNDGYEAYRERVWKRMMDKGILPPGTVLSPLNPLEGRDPDVANADDHVRPWDSLNVKEKRLFAKMMEVYAAFSEYTDAQVGRILDYLESTGQLENTVIIYAADNGASGEGSQNGSVNENKFFNGYPDDIDENLKLIKVLGGPDTYEHFPTGWAVATSTPFKMFKRYAQYAGGTCDPLVISWPAGIKGIKEGGEIRHQYHHATDIVPTILEICKLEMPLYYKGSWQYPLSGVSMAYTFNAKPDDPTKKVRQYYAMLGTRGIWENGWKAVSIHAPLSGKGEFESDAWELYHVETDRSETTDVAKENPDMLRYLQQVWFEEAEKNLVLPLDDRSATQQLGVERPTEEEPRKSYTYYPGTAPVPEAVAPNLRGRSYTIDADVDITETTTGVIFAHGSRFGGHSLFIKEGKLHYVYNFLGIKPEQKFVSEILGPGRYLFRAAFTWLKAGEYGESLGKTELHLKRISPVPDDIFTLAAAGEMRTQIGKFTLSGDGLCIGYDSADAVSEEYKGSNAFKNGTIRRVVITPGEEPVVIPEITLRGAYSAD